MGRENDNILNLGNGVKPRGVSRDVIRVKILLRTLRAHSAYNSKLDSIPEHHPHSAWVARIMYKLWYGMFRP